FGEAAYTGNGGYGLITGADFEVGRNTGLILSYRNYGKKLQSIFGAGFGEQSGTPGNEEGFYIGLEHNLSERVSFSGYFDHFRFSAPRFQTRQPTSGFDWLGFLEIDVNPDLNLYGLLRFQSKEEDYNATDHFGREIRLLSSDRRASGRVQAEYQVHPKVRLRTRLDLNRTEPAGEETGWGFLVFQDLRVGVSRHLRIDARITLFETDGFDSRVYQFENDLLYVLSNRVLFDQGQRMYILLNYQPSRWLEFWLKLSTTLYENRNVISSGLNQINGKRRSDMGIQARIRF
ncbi:MAG: hypothetical protein R3222_11065, partial [Balneolaceae bacterium]|nr:hypothetical protein [Balneolaceae bacterium]